MKSDEEPEIIEPEVIPPEEHGGQRAEEKNSSASLNLHPWSGILIIFVDNAFFAASASTAGIAMPFTCSAAFLLATTGVYFIQRNLAGDSRKTSLGKAVFSGILAGIPTSISGTVLGSAVLLLSGLSSDFFKKR